jgi:hypothetical protein
MDWKNSKALKWAIFFALFFFGLFCFMKDRGYCAEIEFEEIIIEQPEDFFKDRVPLDEEYLYQYYENPLAKSVSFPMYECRSNWQAKPGRNSPPAASQRQKWQDAFDMHSFNAIRTYNDAKDCVWYLPNLTWRQWGRDAWVAACAMASTKTPCQALVVAFSTMLSQYGLHCADQWDYIADKLYWSEYHFNECIKYAQLLQG